MSESSAVMVDTQPHAPTRTTPADAALLDSYGIDWHTCTLVELSCGSELHGLVAAFVTSEAARCASYMMNIGRSSGSCDDGCATTKREVTASLGLGLHEFAFEDKPLYCLVQAFGEPVGTSCGAAVYTTLCLISPEVNDIGRLKRLCDKLVQDADHVHPQKFTVWRWHTEHQYWMRGQVVQARPIESVVLPRATEEALLNDLDEFLAPETRTFYTEHGIPHKRSYLFHGLPGSGKTSSIQAIAGRYGRNVCYLSPAHPDMTDDALKAAMERVPSKSIIVLEDVDALFGPGREQRNMGKSSLTFSGLLNALDGVGGSVGQIFILTTNHRERLDAALIRNGRVDVHIEFKDAEADQIRRLFCQFYKGASEGQAEEFETALSAKLGGRSVSMAALQSFFINMRKKAPGEAIASVELVVEEMDGRDVTKAKADGKSAEEEEAKNEGKKGEGKEEEDKKAAQSKVGGDEDESKKMQRAVASTQASDETHIHVHVHK